MQPRFKCLAHVGLNHGERAQRLLNSAGLCEVYDYNFTARSTEGPCTFRAFSKEDCATLQPLEWYPLKMNRIKQPKSQNTFQQQRKQTMRVVWSSSLVDGTQEQFLFQLHPWFQIPTAHELLVGKKSVCHMPGLL